MLKSMGIPQYSRKRGFRYALLHLANMSQAFRFSAHILCVFPKHASSEGPVPHPGLLRVWNWRSGLAQNVVLAYRACGIPRTYGGAVPATTCGVRALLNLGIRHRFPSILADSWRRRPSSALRSNWNVQGTYEVAIERTTIQAPFEDTPTPARALRLVLTPWQTTRDQAQPTPQSDPQPYSGNSACQPDLLDNIWRSVASPLSAPAFPRSKLEQRASRLTPNTNESGPLQTHQ